MLEARGEAHQSKALSPGDRLQLLLRPAQDCSDLEKAVEQEGPGSVLPEAVTLRLGLEVEPLVGMGPHALARNVLEGVPHVRRSALLGPA
eukprot:7713787-Alexandrium_andersonii.AAC.1